MRGSRLVVVLAAVIVAVGLSTALGLRLLSPARAAVGPLPVEALALPGEANVVGGLHVRRILDSPLYAKYLADKEKDLPEEVREFQECTGVNPQTDIDRIVAAGWKNESGEGTGAVVALGRFDVSKISSYIETEAKGVTSKKVAGSTMYLLEKESKEGDEGEAGHEGEESHEGEEGEESHGNSRPGALAFLGDGAIVMGDPSAVETTISNFAAGNGQGLEANAELLGRVGALRSDAALWVVGDATALSEAPQAVPGGGADGMKIPPLKSLSLTGDFAPAVAIELVGEAADPEAATQLADMLRGLVAMASMQASQKPELKDLATAISVTTEDLLVRVSARFPYELIEFLAPAEPSEAAPDEDAAAEAEAEPKSEK